MFLFYLFYHSLFIYVLTFGRQRLVKSRTPQSICVHESRFRHTTTPFPSDDYVYVQGKPHFRYTTTPFLSDLLIKHSDPVSLRFINKINEYCYVQGKTHFRYTRTPFLSDLFTKRLHPFSLRFIHKKLLCSGQTSF